MGLRPANALWRGSNLKTKTNCQKKMRRKSGEESRKSGYSKKKLAALERFHKVEKKKGWIPLKKAEDVQNLISLKKIKKSIALLLIFSVSLGMLQNIKNI